jgi:polyisoprenoid-binding protein YceI
MLATPARAAQAHFRLDPGATQITAAVAEPLSSIRGDAVASFRAVSGEVDDPGGNPSQAHATIVIDASSYNSGSAMRDRAVTGSLLAAGQYPTITFESTGLKEVKLNSQRSGSATMMGKLTLHGETHSIEFPFSASLGDDGRLTAEGVATFDYTQFGISSPSILGLSAGSVVKVSFHAIVVQ